ncbi:MAG TPA: hydrolase [Anaerohalosphaeraceae bacterium]|jgi:nicotinamidase-related amidase|nr:hydrolase [Anaerohalosphaeraceae bacterium]HRT49384.1 hydrolase [Anaerohalosphaeraceae bacterium]HRT85887.1 hydrolase [Anaerohalosphaeraceae bacterium]
MVNIAKGTDGGLLTKDTCAAAFIDFQPQMMFGVGSVERQQLMNNVLMLAEGVKLFDVPAVITAVESASFSGHVWPQLLDVFGDVPVIERTGMNSWDSGEFRRAIEATRRTNIVVAGLWTEVCVAWPTLNMLAAGYNVFVVADACGGTSWVTHEAAMQRVIQAGAVPCTAMQVVLEFQRDWANRETYDGMMEILKKYGGAYGQGIEYAYTMVHGAEASRKHGMGAGF